MQPFVGGGWGWGGGMVALNNEALQALLFLIFFFVQFVRCCGVNSPDDWQRNVYFNCSSVAFQRCSVPPSCCILVRLFSPSIIIYLPHTLVWYAMQVSGEVINQQCGYQALNSTSVSHSSARFLIQDKFRHPSSDIIINIMSCVGVDIEILFMPVLVKLF